MSIELDSRAAGMSRGGSSSALALEGLNECSPCSSSSSASASPSPSPSPSSSSSIGRNSDVSSDGEDCGENEAQSSYKGPLDMMEALEEVLPIRFVIFLFLFLGFKFYGVFLVDFCCRM